MMNKGDEDNSTAVASGLVDITTLNSIGDCNVPQPQTSHYVRQRASGTTMSEESTHTIEGCDGPKSPPDRDTPTHDSITTIPDEKLYPDINDEASLNTSAHFSVEVISTPVTENDEAESQAQTWRRRRTVTLYLITITILFADMNLLAPNLSVIADEFGMDDDERDVRLGGLIALGFFFVGAPVSFAVGWLADYTNRSSLFATTVFFGEVGCFMVTFVQSYWQLYLCR